MNCPKCGKPPVSVLEYVLMLSLRDDLRCRNCKARLVRGKLLRRIYGVGVLIGVVLGAGCVALGAVFGWRLGPALLAALAAAVVLCAPLEYIGWKYGRYELRESDTSASETTSQQDNE